VGDQLLQDVARRLTRCVRESDTVGRIGGDEFIILLESIKQPEEAAIVTGKIMANLSEPCKLAKVTLQIIPSIGVAVYPENGEDGNELIRFADDAMYQIKKRRQQSASR
jgi:diguanylate cyclase (GGDEF)-like protein